MSYLERLTKVGPRAGTWASSLKVAGALLGAGLLLTACGGSASEQKGPVTATGDELVAAAQAEGTVTIYSNMASKNLEQLVSVFQDKYGIEVQGVDIDSTLGTRFMSEAQAGQTAADVVIMPRDRAFVEDATKAGYIVPVKDFGAEAVTGGTYPDKFLTEEGSAIFGLSPLGIAVNTDKVPEGTVTSWDDLTGPQFANQLLVNDPRVSTYYIEALDALYTDKGPDYFKAVGKNSPRVFLSGGEGAQQLAVGEVSAMFPASEDTLASSIAKGAPVKWIEQDTTSAVEYTIMPVNPERAPHPNAEKLFVDFFLSEEGNKALFSVGGTKSVYTPDQLPATLLDRRDPRQIDTLDAIVADLNLK